MKIAVTYDNGNVFQHFGKTESFKVYEVEDNRVVKSEIIGSNGTGHGALAGLLAEQGIDVLICGGIGGGAQAALAEAGVELCSGAEGDTDAGGTEGRRILYQGIPDLQLLRTRSCKGIQGTVPADPDPCKRRSKRRQRCNMGKERRRGSWSRRTFDQGKRCRYYSKRKEAA